MIKLSKPSGLELLRLRRHADSLLTFLKRGKKSLSYHQTFIAKYFRKVKLIYKVNYNEYKYFKFILIKNYS